jgi:uncharacterized protein
MSALAESDGTTRQTNVAAGAAERGDWDAALAIWVDHAHAGAAIAQATIGRCFLKGWGVARDAGLALKWLPLSAKAGNALGHSLLGDFYFNGKDGSPDRSIAEEWYARAAGQGHVHAAWEPPRSAMQHMPSWILRDADHPKADYQEAMRRALAVAKLGVTASMEAAP